ILVPSQVLGVAYSILAMAQDPDVRVLSMSMGSIFRIYQLEGAIDYLNSQGKILVSAAGTSFPFIKDLIGVVFPASYEPVVAATGIENREETGGEFVLGQSAHGGPQVDITIEREGSSSEATSGFAGMLALIWSANPSLTREEVLDIAVRSTWFYQQNGQKHPVFGWGTPDVLWAVEEAL
ncbi:MAG: S8/S53 family peptidase, partial [Chitinophagaceae bacterium]|nr:S8/S53 family peptidase [Chitinophagaceae bacterium]